MRRALPLLLMVTVGCTIETAPDDLAAARHVDTRAEFDFSCAGQCSTITCKPRQLVLDPAWGDLTDVVRDGVRLWEDAVGVDLGPLPLAASCEPGARAPNCIAVRGVAVRGKAEPEPGIDIYLETLQRYTTDLEDLRMVIAHEVGHWIGIRQHTDSGLMATGALQPPEVTAADVVAYEQACVD